MKTKMIKVVALAILISLTSCKKENLNSSPGGQSNPGNTENQSSGLQQRSTELCPITDGVSVSGGILSFTSPDAFNAVVEDIQFKHDTLCNGDSTNFYRVSKCFENLFSYTSLRSVIENSHLAALNNEVYDLENDLDNKYFPHTGIRTVCNGRGEVKIGAELHVYTSYGDIFIVHDGNTSYTEDINNSIFSNLNNVTRYVADGSELFYTNGSPVTRVAKKECKTWLKINNKYYNNGNRMIRLSNWTLNSPNLNTTGSETWVYRKVGRTWVLAWVSGLNVNYGGNIHNKNCDWMVFMSGSNSGNNNHHRRAANDIWTSNGFAMNVARRVVNGTYGGNSWASGSGVLNITVN